MKAPWTWRSPVPALLAVDLALVALAWWLAFWLRFNLDVPPEFAALGLRSTPLALVAYGVVLLALRVHRHVWKYTSLPELRRLAAAVGLGAALTAVSVLMVRLPQFPRSVLLLHPVLVVLLLGAVRAGWRSLVERTERLAGGARPLLVLGSLQDAAGALRALKGSSNWLPVGILTPLASERWRSLQDIAVVGTLSELAQAATRSGVHTALVASPVGSDARRQALQLAAEARITLLTLPRPDEFLRAEGSAGLRKIQLEDLLGRAPVALDAENLAEMFSGHVVAITGAGGSIGSELCRQVARLGVGRLVCIDISEYAIYQLEQELRQAHPQMQGVYYTANIRDEARLRAILDQHRPAVVFHAAAYKHVPLMEEHNEVEALRTNVLGTLNVARAAAACGARRFVMISTDKAVNPTNVMGASKRLAEMVVQAVAAREPRTDFVSVRFGNVLGSSGSVVPLFNAQIARGGPVTVTHPDIVRYFMTIPEAAQLVLQAGLMGRSGQIFVLDMGDAVKIVELARMLIRLHGKTEEEVPISYIGLRPGEKLFEELLANDETTEPTPHAKLRIAKTNGALLGVEEIVRWVDQAGPQPDARALRDWLQAQVPEYKPR
ncbi:polysaccharide biosynthesis protein [Ramlibacter sp. G-1-2-2]|uniref:Polysaccharide biosynthesis protein n=1 Tax=Ramlibacter agri TaxID=2728837 RepID=A0A848HEA9_9BURK|nr:nucleoside-diphosphate sugar epimerase/dehydratase [Ramlibacter agri]NML46873.1 polysaccharide biosynthesis protein [Ramlibacter agri]